MSGAVTDRREARPRSAASGLTAPLQRPPTAPRPVGSATAPLATPTAQSDGGSYHTKVPELVPELVPIGNCPA